MAVEQTFSGDILPIPLMELDFRRRRLLDQDLGVVRPERRVTAQEDVGDDARFQVS